LLTSHHYFKFVVQNKSKDLFCPPCVYAFTYSRLIWFGVWSCICSDGILLHW